MPYIYIYIYQVMFLLLNKKRRNWLPIKDVASSNRYDLLRKFPKVLRAFSKAPFLRISFDRDKSFAMNDVSAHFGGTFTHAISEDIKQSNWLFSPGRLCSL